MNICPEATKREAMDDAEFWEYVLLGHDAGYDREYDPDDDAGAPRPEDPQLTLIPCPVCGTHYEACGYDTEGRPMIHTTPPEDDDG